MWTEIHESETFRFSIITLHNHEVADSPMIWKLFFEEILCNILIKIFEIQICEIFIRGNISVILPYKFANTSEGA